LVLFRIVVPKVGTLEANYSLLIGKLAKLFVLILTSCRCHDHTNVRFVSFLQHGTSRHIEISMHESLSANLTVPKT